MEEIASIDLFVVPTIAFQQHSHFLFLAIDGGPLLWFAVTPNPTAEWLARQFTEAFPWDTAPEYLIRDNDRAFGGRAPHPGVLRLWLALMLAGELTRGSIGTIPETIKIENTQRYREVLWLMSQSAANQSLKRDSLLTGKSTRSACHTW